MSTFVLIHGMGHGGWCWEQVQEHLVYVAAAMVGSDGLLPVLARDYPAAADIARIRPTAISCMMTPTGAEPWHATASTYVLCTQDGAIHPELQRTMSSRADVVVELDTDHSPFMSVPDQLTDILAGGQA